MVPLGRGTGCSKDHYDSCSRESALGVILRSGNESVVV